MFLKITIKVEKNIKSESRSMVWGGSEKYPERGVGGNEKAISHTMKNPCFQKNYQTYCVTIEEHQSTSPLFSYNFHSFLYF